MNVFKCSFVGCILQIVFCEKPTLSWLRIRREAIRRRSSEINPLCIHAARGGFLLRNFSPDSRHMHSTRLTIRRVYLERKSRMLEFCDCILNLPPSSVDSFSYVRNSTVLVMQDLIVNVDELTLNTADHTTHRWFASVLSAFCRWTLCHNFPMRVILHTDHDFDIYVIT